MTSPAIPIEQDALVRLTRDLTADELEWAEQPRNRLRQFTVDDYLTADDSDNELGVAFATGSADGNLGGIIVPADAVEVVKTAAQMAARRPPTVQQLRAAVQSALTSLIEDDFEVHETDRDGAAAVEAYGTTTDGLGFGFHVQITNVWETDL